MEINEIDLEKLRELLPHGSGIDGEWHIERCGKRIVADCSYHRMDENGYYDGWQDFRVTLYTVPRTIEHALKGPCEGQTQIVARKGDTDFRLSFPGGFQRGVSGFGIREYLEETFQWAFSDAGIID